MTDENNKQNYKHNYERKCTNNFYLLKLFSDEKILYRYKDRDMND